MAANVSRGYRSPPGRRLRAIHSRWPRAALLRQQVAKCIDGAVGRINRLTEAKMGRLGVEGLGM